MSNCYNTNVSAYTAAMLYAEKLLRNGLISGKEYDEIDTILAKKYEISSCSIYRRNSWITTPTQVNMSHTTEVT